MFGWWNELTGLAKVRRELRLALIDYLAARESRDFFMNACTKTNHEIEQILGQALGYPRYADDPENFPDATDADGVCVGEHTALSLADEIVARLADVQSDLDSSKGFARSRDELLKVAQDERDRFQREAAAVRRECASPLRDRANVENVLRDIRAIQAKAKTYEETGIYPTPNVGFPVQL